MAQLTLPQALEIARQRHESGELAGASALYQQIIRYDPHNTDALHLLGVIYAQCGDAAAAEKLIRQAIHIHGEVASYWNSLGNVLKDGPRVDEAIECYRRAAALPGGSIEAYGNLGTIWLKKEEFQKSIDAYRSGLELMPPAVIEYRLRTDLGIAYGKNHQFDLALSEFHYVLSKDPNHAHAQQNLGVILVQMGKTDEAIAACRRAIELQKNLFEAHLNLGMALARKSLHEEAIVAYRQALELAPRDLAIRMSLVHSLSKMGLMDAAIETAKEMVDIDATATIAHEAYASVLAEVGRFDEALREFELAVQDPAKSRVGHSGRLFYRMFHVEETHEAMAADAREWDSRHTSPLYPAQLNFPNDRSPERRLKIGYVSPNFLNHCQSFFTIPLFEAHDPRAVDIYCYADIAQSLEPPHPLTERIKSAAHHWRETVGLSHHQLAEQVRRDEIDILVDLTMHMTDSRLLAFAEKPAPVQVTWLAYPGTTGVRAIDYRISDPYLDPPAKHDRPAMFDHLYAEKTIRLRDTFWIYDPLEAVEVGPPPLVKNGFITFGCLNNFTKVNQPLLELWSRVLLALPNSRLLLLAPIGQRREWVKEAFAACGIASERVEFVNRMSRTEYLRCYHRIDITLDTLPYNGHTTSLDSLWMGVPVVTIVGNTVVGRAGLSQLSNLGLTELVAGDREEFVRIAGELASDSERLTAVRASLRQRMVGSPLMDKRRFARSMEAAYRTMWRAWSTGDSASPSIGKSV